jgi:hypothetical protein
MEQHTCKKCGQNLPRSEFYPNGPGRPQPNCKRCQKLAVAEWRQKNREQHNANARRWREANPERVREINHQQYVKNKTERLAKNKAWAQANPEKCRAAEKRWRAKPKSKEVNRLRAQRHRCRRPEMTKAAEKKWRAKNPHLICGYAKKRRALKKGAPINDFTATQWIELQAEHDYCCAYCGQRCEGRLTQDHVQPLSKGGSHTLSNIVPACQGCNSSKNNGRERPTDHHLKRRRQAAADGDQSSSRPT